VRGNSSSRAGPPIDRLGHPPAVMRGDFDEELEEFFAYTHAARRADLA
jgi:hypothetical protein